MKEAQEELKKIDGITKKSESATRNPLPPNFMSCLHQAISNEQLKRDESGNDLIGEILLHEREANNGATTENTNERILKAANLHSNVPNDNQKHTVQELKGNDKHVNSLGNKNKQPWEYTPVVDPCNVTAKEIQRYSGFEDLNSLLT